MENMNGWVENNARKNLIDEFGALSKEENGRRKNLRKYTRVTRGLDELEIKSMIYRKEANE